jgi:hypothetical protein
VVVESAAGGLLIRAVGRDGGAEVSAPAAGSSTADAALWVERLVGIRWEAKGVTESRMGKARSAATCAVVFDLEAAIFWTA